MRALPARLTAATLTAALAALLAVPGLARAVDDDPVRLEIEVGKTSAPLGMLPRCDDLGVAAPTADGTALRGLKLGETLCSFDRSGGAGRRLVYRVVVIPPKPGSAPAGSEKEPSPPGRAR